MRFGSLFSGIGGMDLGLERAGMSCAWQVEIDDYATRVLTKHWPGVPKFRDVRECGRANLEPVDLIAGGFPCQDVSLAGKQAGLIEGNRSGLWFEFYRIICELRPRYALIENVPGLIRNGLDRVLCDLAKSGYDAEWETISACAFGAPYPRRRVFIVAINQSLPVQESVFHPQRGLQGQFGRDGNDLPGAHWQADKPSMVGMAGRLPEYVGIATGLGNAVVPQVAEYIGRQILNSQ